MMSMKVNAPPEKVRVYQRLLENVEGVNAKPVQTIQPKTTRKA